ncbi:uncharacterized protein PHACADRAFT_187578 [Phanerochaete carnosa HHB-10118-sp]|uniref:Uncharacterized protein n=1 Tax=Phanerochaete carnosa (strain HHB-10118-sp) TaxID=650164 RepID=K5VVV5_PHACS|nr:uncharacterized protein PHACADRAFT_187578 [Phanerochaete carnosa HHB-10118-sp]EKM50940.1 hypothetical protein PHACADRAFT_187578 [Phanerochaete carnosa HHB-10118-sp]
MSNASEPLGNPVIINAVAECGGTLIGVIVSAVLWGISCMQMLVHSTTSSHSPSNQPFYAGSCIFLNYDSDRWLLKLLVFYVWIAETVVEVLGFVGQFDQFFTRRGSIIAFDTLARGLVVCVIHFVQVSEVRAIDNSFVTLMKIRTTLAPFISIPVQMVFLYRIHRCLLVSQSREWTMRAATIFTVRAEYFWSIHVNTRAERRLLDYVIHLAAAGMDRMGLVSIIPVSRVISASADGLYSNSRDGLGSTLASHRVVTIEIISRAIPAFVDVFIAL